MSNKKEEDMSSQIDLFNSIQLDINLLKYMKMSELMKPFHNSNYKISSEDIDHIYKHHSNLFNLLYFSRS